MTTSPLTLLPAAATDAAIGSSHTRRAYGRHLTDAFTALGVQAVAELNGAQQERLHPWPPSASGKGRTTPR